MKLENSKEALHKAQGTPISKKNDLGEATESNTGKEKRKGEEKRVKILKKHQNRPVKNKVPRSKYTNYQSLTAPMDYIYAVIEENLYRAQY